MCFAILKKIAIYFESPYIKYRKEQKKAEQIFWETIGEDKLSLDFWNFTEYVASHTKLTMSEAAMFYAFCKVYNITKEIIIEKANKG